MVKKREDAILPYEIPLCTFKPSPDGEGGPLAVDEVRQLLAT
jgi:hypothetical protein